MVCHFTSEVSDFGRNHLTAVGGRLECGHYTVALLELGGGAVQAFGKVVKAVYGASHFFAVASFPGQEHAVACNLVNFTVVFFAAVRKQSVVISNKVAVSHVPEFFGNLGRMLHVDEHENQVFFLGVLVLAEQGVNEHAGPELLVYGTDKGNQVPEHEQFENQDVRFGLLEYVQHVLQGGFVYKAFATVDVPNQNAQRQVRTNACDKEPRANQKCRYYVPLVHFVLQNDHVVNGVRKACQ